MTGLRRDRVALRLTADLQAALGPAVPAGRTLIVTVTAPIRKAAATALALERELTPRLARAAARLRFRDDVCGNDVQARLLADGRGGVVVYVHNPDVDVEPLFAP